MRLAWEAFGGGAPPRTPVPSSEGKEAIVESSQIWLIVGIVAAILVLIALVLVFRRRRGQQTQVRARNKAAELREEAVDREADLKEREAREARARAAALEAEAEAQRRRHEAKEHGQDLQGIREDVEQRRVRADEIDPDVPDQPRSR